MKLFGRRRRPLAFPDGYVPPSASLTPPARRKNAFCQTCGDVVCPDCYPGATLYSANEQLATALTLVLDAWNDEDADLVGALDQARAVLEQAERPDDD